MAAQLPSRHTTWMSDARCDSGRWPWHPATRRDHGEAQTDGRNRRPADPVAHHEALRALRLQRVHRRAGLQGRLDQAPFPRLPRREQQHHDQPGHRPGRHAQQAVRRLAGPPGRNRPRHQHRRPRQTTAALARCRHVHGHLRRRRVRRRSARSAASFTRHRARGHGDGRAPAGALRRLDVRRRPGGALHRKAASRRRLDQRRLHGLRAEDFRLSGWRRQQPGDRGPGAAGRRGPTGRLPARSLLAVHGYAPRQAPARSAVGTEQGPWKVWQ